MGEVAGRDSANPSLEVSVSFGRFENDSLSWEKWSAFSPNKYLEEVEKCATPGSVAQKKAYFEAHYIAARKLLEQEMQMQNDDPLKSDDQSNGDQICSGTDNGIEIATGQTSGNSIAELNSENGISSGHVEAFMEDDEDVFAMECQTSRTEEREIKETDSGVVSPKTPNLNRPEELVLVKEVETIKPDTQETVTDVPKTLSNDAGVAPEVKEEKARSDLQKGPQKVTSLSKDRRTVAKAKNKSVSPRTKTPQKPTPRVSKLLQSSTPKESRLPQNSTPRVSAPQNSTPRVSKISQNATPRVTKPMSPSTGSKSAPRPSVSNVNGSSLARSTHPSSERIKKVPPGSLHMSPSSDPKRTNSATETTVTGRKSLIMDEMGDKDIVRRALKTFQKSVNKSKSANEDKSSMPKQRSTKAKDSKVPASISLLKNNGRSSNTSSQDKRNAKAAPSLGFRNEQKAEKKELTSYQNLVPEMQREHIPNQSQRFLTQEQKEAEVKRLRQSHKLKASPATASYPGQKLS